MLNHLLNASSDLSHVTIALFTLPVLAYLFVNAVGLVLTVFVAVALLASFYLGIALIGIVSITMLPVVSIGAGAVLCWLLVSNLTREDERSTSGC
ncbi:hypothetical protein [Burkholderia gladioli]|uniref:hypothetical protein n=1 Tax=Burkholderia gladioli TaxID=28095 RepID=UPI0016411B0D|nr:hypothetical protein [Burkholderia gladioli]